MPGGDPARQVVVTGLAVLSALGDGTGPLVEAAWAGKPAFAPVTRFDVAGRRVRHAAHLPGAPRLAAELTRVVGEAAAGAGLDREQAGRAPLLLALHSDTRTAATVAEVGAAVRDTVGLPAVTSTAVGACTASSGALADAAVLLTAGRAQTAVVAAGYLVEPDTYALFDAASALSRDGEVRPFSRDRRGPLLGDAVVAVVLETAGSAHSRGVRPLAALAGWGRTGDAHHVCRPAPDGAGLARAVTAALARAGVAPGDVGYVNANGTGSVLADAAETRALHAVFGPGDGPPVSSTKSVHGHALEASALLEFAVTVESLRAGLLPVNAGYLGSADDCRLDLVLHAPREARPRYALSLNSAFGGANTALLVEAAA
ncbi:beta-ketoacyl-[acyl-carrier-protein] synthase family protein [Streptantibioticus silvisoli]|uniref:Beta-ketoacyl synthase N-terminal-like domain-containing protein n=1 Tax=Streptantibioticus silvisoli TaxID=2705255 RepID=A0ABT6VRY9_9ACTN|nr:beta-ketoacyl synthase N-terminal-like domain-containing protein [Streptantibioticus silvisoli]MDI5961243.1 beta-ketoacyl synthase N-terminal-like domain-containing protein [Streptantibioticus silvisoli]